MNLKLSLEQDCLSFLPFDDCVLVIQGLDDDVGTCLMGKIESVATLGDLVKGLWVVYGLWEGNVSSELSFCAHRSHASVKWDWTGCTLHLRLPSS